MRRHNFGQRFNLVRGRQEGQRKIERYLCKLVRSLVSREDVKSISKLSQVSWLNPQKRNMVRGCRKEERYLRFLEKRTS